MTMECMHTGQEVEPVALDEGILLCPACGEEMDEETLEVLSPPLITTTKEGRSS